MNRSRAATCSPASEAGFALLEVIVSAAVLALVAVAVLAGIDGAQSSTGREKSRSVAANLAEQDQERMRSLQADSLADYTETRTVNVDGNNFSVLSTGSWVRDATGGTVSCQNNSTEADYLQISSTVTNSSVGIRTKPVVIQSLVAPSVAYSSTRGSLAVQVNDRNGAGVPGLLVSIAGPSSDSTLTNDSGCAVFQYIPIGNYDITLNRPGWVDHFGTTVSVGNQDVTANTLNLRTMDYDAAGSLVASVHTWKPGSTTTAAANAISSSFAYDVSATNSGESGLMRVFAPTPTTTAVSSLSLTNLFPFKNPYGVFTGACPEGNPVTYDSDYFDTFVGSKIVPPGASAAVDVLQPPLNLRIKDSGGSGGAYRDGVTVVMTQRTTPAGCGQQFTMTTMTNPSTSSAGWPSNSTTSFDPGLPWGRYDVCAEYKVSTGNYRYYDPTPSAAIAYENITALGRGPTSTPTPLGTLTVPPSSSDWQSSSFAGHCT